MTRSDELDLVARLSTLSDSILQADSVDAALDAIVRSIGSLMPAAEHASVTRVHRGSFSTVASTSESATGMDMMQYSAAEGPCVDAARGATVTRTDDVLVDARWPRLSRLAGSHAAGSLRSVMSCSLPTRDQRADLEESLNTYSATPSAFDDDEADLLSVVCSHAGTLLAVLSRSLAAEQTAESLREAIATRDVIGQAKGILMERHHITEDAAFDILRVTSQRLNRKLRDVAAELTFAGELPLADSADAVGSPES